MNPPPKRCLNCGADNLPLAPRCPSCGHDFAGPIAAAPQAPIQPDPPVVAYCATCGAKVLPGAGFCSTCGTAVGTASSKAASPKADRAGLAVSPIALVGGALVVLLIAAAVLALGNQTGGQHPIADVTASPTRSAAPAPTATPGTDLAVTACRLIGDLTAAQNDNIVPMVSLISFWTAGPSIPVGPEPRARAAAYAAAVMQVIARNAAAVGSLRSSERPQLVADIARAYSSYGSGLAALAPAFKNSNTYDSIDALKSGLQQIGDGRTALDDANAQLGLMIAAGSANCP